jgi:hypothetical protein
MTTPTPQLPALLPLLTTVALERGPGLPPELRSEAALIKVAEEFDWAGQFKTDVWFAEAFSVAVPESLEAQIQAEPGGYLHDLSLWLGRDVFDTFEFALEVDDFAYPITRLRKRGYFDVKEATELATEFNLPDRWTAWPRRPQLSERTTRVTFRELTAQEIEARIAQRRAEAQERLAQLVEGSPLTPERRGIIEGSLRRALGPGGRLEQDAILLRRELAVPPAQRLGAFVDAWISDALQDWEDRERLRVEEDWAAEYCMLPMLAEVRLLLDYGEVQLAFLALREHFQGCFPSGFDLNEDVWMDVTFA